MPAKTKVSELNTDDKIRLGLRSVGSIERKMVKCGRSNCRCTDGKLHGPYHFHLFREYINGNYVKRRKYVLAKNLDTFQAKLEQTKLEKKNRKDYERQLLEQVRKINIRELFYGTD